MITNHQLLIDADCPMCKLYGKGFEKYGLVEKGTCSPYQTTTAATAKFVDMKRAKNEIALHNIQTGETVYGIKAFQKILIERFEWLKHPFGSKPIEWLLQKLYKFVSMNRKVIAPSPQRASVWDCLPDLNVKYRIFFLFFGVLLSSIILNAYLPPINTLMGWETHFGTEFLVCAGQIFWQSAFLWRLGREKLLNYLGNMITVSIIGSLLLLPVLLLSKFVSLSANASLGYFLFIVLGMMAEHFRRTKMLDISILATASWLVYRLFILVLL
jgi:hypothetical protein